MPTPKTSSLRPARPLMARRGMVRFSPNTAKALSLDVVQAELAARDQRVDPAGRDEATTPVPAPGRSIRRSVARRASARRHVRRDQRRDPDALIIAFLTEHPDSTVGDLAKALDIGYELVASHLIHLGATGRTERTTHGFRIPHPIQEP
jgi:hypothetical protein